MEPVHPCDSRRRCAQQVMEEGLPQDFSVTISDDRRSIQTQVSRCHSNHTRPELLDTRPEDLERLFNRSLNVEQDICFPEPARTASPSRDRSSRSPRDIDLGALLQLRDETLISDQSKKQDPLNRPQTEPDTCPKKLSLYGDNHTQTVPVHEGVDRYMYFHPETRCLSRRTLQDLWHADVTLEELLLKSNYWIDITSPTASEMKTISKIFRIHPLTTEDIMSQEIREKCDAFRNYLFVCYRAFVHDGQQLKPVSFYNIVFRRCVLTFHFGQVPHVDHVRQRVEQLQEYITVIPDWINYAVIDEITDCFAPLIQQIDLEVDAIEDLVLLLNTTDQSDMVSRIGSCRKRVMQMLRLLGSKADVVRALIKRFEERAREEHGHHHHRTTGSVSSWSSKSTPALSSSTTPAMKPTIPSPLHDTKKRTDSITAVVSTFLLDEIETEEDGRIFPDVALYLGDVQDHILTMLQNLNHYETVLARSHSNYLARMSIELTQTSNSTNHVIGRLTIFATVLLPMNLVTGLWGMNVKVPGKDYDNLIYFFWIVCSLAAFAVFSLTIARHLKLF